ncbi:MAG TPA: glycosyltransferase, partial [Actinomycetota bacterium]|nr:glycosyltransferase [Actinomycetota bacterium]
MRLRRAARVAVITVHSSPTDQPGTGDSGGMNVYVREVARRLNDHGVEVDVFTRGHARDGGDVAAIGPATRVIRVPAGPPVPLLKTELARFVEPFAGAMLARADGRGYDLVQSHYWISGLVGRGVKRRWGVPLVALFHTLARVKNRSLADGDPPEPDERILGEDAVLREADLVVLPTPSEAANLQELYGADRGRIRLAPPGVDTRLFRPRDRARARARAGLDGGPVVLFAGRLQSLKGPDVAVRAMAELLRAAPDLG